MDRAEWIYKDADTIVDKAFEEVLSNHPDLHDTVKAQVSVLYQSFKSLTMVISLDICPMKIEEL